MTVARFGIPAAILLGMLCPPSAIAQQTASSGGESPGRVERVVNAASAISVTWDSGTAILDWMPRRASTRKAQQLDIRASVGGHNLSMAVLRKFPDMPASVNVALMIDVGASISASEASAFVGHANRIMSLAGSNQAELILSFADKVLSRSRPIHGAQGTLSSGDAFQPSKNASRPVETALLVGRALASLGGVRRAVFVMTDGVNCAPEPELPDVQSDVAAYRATGVSYFPVLYTDTKPTDRCIGALATLAETSGGAIYSIDKTGSNPQQPQDAELMLNAGAEVSFDMSGVRIPPGLPSPPLKVSVRYDGEETEMSLPVAFSAMSYPQYWVQLVAQHGIGLGLLLALVAAAFLVVAFVVAAARGSPPNAWLSPIGYDGPPIPLPPGKTVISLGARSDAAHIRISATGRRFKLRTRTPIEVNGTRLKSAWLSSGDIINLEGMGSYSYRFYRFAKDEK